MALSQARKQEIISKFGKTDNDSGDTSVQIALLTYWIKDLTEHLKVNKKDNASKLSLFKLVSRRYRFLKYLKRVNNEKYLSLTTELSLKRHH